jgi:DNA replication protein DnaC
MERNTECWYVDTCKDDCGICNVFFQMKYQMEHSGLPKAKQKAIGLWLVDDIDEDAFNRLAEIRKDIVNFVESGKNLYICSDYTGNGKTSWAIKMLHTYFHHTAVGNYDNLKGMFVSTTELLLQLKDFNNPLPKAYLDNLKNVDLVVWDDIAVSGMSQYDFTQLYTIIDKRILAEKSNIFTSNQPTVKGFANAMGNRLASRIYYTSEIVELKGKDMR